MTKFPNIFSKIKVANTELKNRIIMGSMHTGLEEDKQDLSRLASFYAKRAEGGVGLIVTGGISPNISGWLGPFSARMSRPRDMRRHQIITDSVHNHDGKIAMQILHAGRYGYHPLAKAPSRIKSPISPFTPWKLTNYGIKSTINDYIKASVLAKQAGYDGVEIMGSEGYLINQFLVKRTNKRNDQWGGDITKRMQFPVKIVEGIREAVGDDFIIIYRLSMLDLVEEGNTIEENLQVMNAVTYAGASIINTGIGWHEAKIPTIATSIPRAGFSWVTKEFKKHCKLPLVASNRINRPEVAEEILENNDADLISMARPFLSDPEFVNKAKTSKEKLINTCIACNQACLDNVFKHKRATCMVNPMACFEDEIKIPSVLKSKKIAVIGSGPAGCACAITLAKMGHVVTLYEGASEIGGQFNIAKKIPGKIEYQSTIDYFNNTLEHLGVEIKTNHFVTKDYLNTKDYENIVIATGIKPRKLAIPGIGHKKVKTYIDVLQKGEKVGDRVAIIGAGGIGFDTASFILHQEYKNDVSKYAEYWGIDTSLKNSGGLTIANNTNPKREVYLLQRKSTKFGKNLGKTTGWIHRKKLSNDKVKMLGGCHYEKIDDQGLHIKIEEDIRILDVDTIIVCAGQDPYKDLYEELTKDNKFDVSVIGGANFASELDAVRAIKEGTLTAINI